MLEELKQVRRLIIGNRILLAAIFFIIVLVGSLLWMLCQIPEGAIARGVTVGPLDVGGLNKDQALQMLQSQTNLLENQGVNFVYKNIQANLTAVYNPENNPEFSREVFKCNPEKTIETAYQIGREGASLKRYWSRLITRLFGKEILAICNLDSEQALRVLKQNLTSYEEIPQNANLAVNWQDNGWRITEIKERTGKIFNYDEALAELKIHLAKVDHSSILLHLKTVEPSLYLENVSLLRLSLEKILGQGDLTINFSDKKFIVDSKEWATWLSVSAIENGRKEILDLNDKATVYLRETIASQIEKPVQEAKFSMKNGKVEEFQAGEEGKKIDLSVSLDYLKDALLKGTMSADLVMIKTEPTANVETINEMGIKELVSVGKTNFAGSPANRRHNIKVGAAALNGVLIAPDEEFSTIKKLSPIDETSGYLPELVIKGNITKPEFGGGLCQISTTLFRAVLNAGLPVLERSNHAYRVSYYEPPVGFDATIYDPKPDFRFTNDTGHYLLLQTKVIGNEVIFEFWGTKDGRTITQSTPKQYNYKPPPAPRLVETLTLPVGQKKCTEKAHAGIDAVFTYEVFYPSGEKKMQDFYSKYRPWGEVCLIGVEKLTETTVSGDLVVPPVLPIVSTPEIPVVAPATSSSTPN